MNNIYYILVLVNPVCGATRVSAVMPALVAGIHDFAALHKEDVDARDKPGHDELA
jgi:hypothetical protein